MTVPDPTSVPCQTRQHSRCDGSAHNLLTDQPAPCACRCHPRRSR